jgi:hypothetical protein
MHTAPEHRGLPLHTPGRRQLGLIGVILMLGLTLAGGTARAQEQRVYTKVFAPRPGTSDTRGLEPLARSTTLFHAGRAFDHLESSDEIVVFEPAHERFVLLDPTREAQAEITFAEIENLVHRATHRAKQFVQQAESRRDAKEKDLVKLVKCQLEPPFHEQYDPTANTLSLECDAIKYSVATAPNADAAVVRQYVRYADWTARLNFVLHPQAAPPEPRLRLNAALGRLQVLPVRVRLEILSQPKSVRVAEHVFDSKLTSEDRRQLTLWDGLMRSGTLKTIPFADFQGAARGGKTAGK